MDQTDQIFTFITAVTLKFQRTGVGDKSTWYEWAVVFKSLNKVTYLENIQGVGEGHSQVCNIDNLQLKL